MFAGHVGAALAIGRAERRVYTFTRNLGACSFYERNGFTTVARGFEPLWQLEDLKYNWSAGAHNTA